MSVKARHSARRARKTTAKKQRAEAATAFFESPWSRILVPTILIIIAIWQFSGVGDEVSVVKTDLAAVQAKQAEQAIELQSQEDELASLRTGVAKLTVSLDDAVRKLRTVKRDLDKVGLLIEDLQGIRQELIDAVTGST